jgi:hypothetical protein
MTRHLGIDPGKHHVGMCLYDPDATCILSWDCVTIDDTTVSRFIETFRACLENIVGDGPAPTRISIERQPPKNTTMCRISHYMHMYLALTYPDAEIRIVPPTRRLKYMKLEHPDLPFDTYTQRKKSSIRCVEAWLETTKSTWNGWFHDQTKRDDCAESFLLCLI